MQRYVLPCAGYAVLAMSRACALVVIDGPARVLESRVFGSELLDQQADVLMCRDC